jgi:hypothetical protein
MPGMTAAEYLGNRPSQARARLRTQVWPPSAGPFPGLSLAPVWAGRFRKESEVPSTSRVLRLWPRWPPARRRMLPPQRSAGVNPLGTRRWTSRQPGLRRVNRTSRLGTPKVLSPRLDLSPATRFPRRNSARKSPCLCGPDIRPPVFHCPAFRETRARGHGR